MKKPWLTRNEITRFCVACCLFGFSIGGVARLGLDALPLVCVAFGVGVPLFIDTLISRSLRLR